MSSPNLFHQPRTRPVLLCSLMAAGTLALAGLVSAAGSVLWQDHFDSGKDDQPADVALAGAQLIAVGTKGTATNDRSFYVRATSALDGTFLWDDLLEFPGGSLRAFQVAIGGPSAFVVGEGDDAAGDHYLVVRAYNWRTGVLLWEDKASLFRTVSFRLPSIATTGDRVFVATARPALSGTGRNMVVRAYDAGTGALLWEDRFDRGGDDFIDNVVAQGALVFVSGAAAAAPFPVQTDFAVRALDAATGALVWQDFYDFDGNLDQARGIAVGQGRVFAVGFGRHADGNGDLIVRAYEANTGVPLWTDAFDLAGESDFATRIAVLGSRVFIAGHASDALGNTDFLVRAYDADTGALVWQDLSDGPGNFDNASALDGRGNLLYVTGRMGSGMGLVGDLQAVVRAYDAGTGTLVWEDRFGPPGVFNFANGIVIGERAAFVKGAISPAGSFDWFLRAYQLAPSQ